MKICTLFASSREHLRVKREADKFETSFGDRAFELAMLRLHFAKADNNANQIDFLKKVISEISRRAKRREVVRSALGGEALQSVQTSCRDLTSWKKKKLSRANEN